MTTSLRENNIRSYPRKPLLCLTAVLFLSIASLLSDSYFESSPSSIWTRRSMLASPSFTNSNTHYLETSHSTLLPFAHHNLRSVRETPDPTSETALFWHIPKSGGTTAKRIYECFGQVLANRIGGDPRYEHYDAEEIIVFSPFPKNPTARFANVDTTSQSGILRAEKLGLVPSKKVDMIFTSDVNFASDHLFDRENKGRIFSLFRHPVDRSVSKFYYLQTATWEKTYRPEWKDMPLVEWAREHNLDENFMVKKILGKKLADTVDLGDLIVAKEIVRRRFVVGLMNEMEESIKRFNVILGIDEGEEKNRVCMEQFFGRHEEEEVEEVQQPSEEEETKTEDGDEEESEAQVEARAKATDNKNSNAHPKIVEGTPEWDILAERNNLDMILYDYIVMLFRSQKPIIRSYAQEAAAKKS